MLVLTVQDEMVVKALKRGRYKADFWKSRFSCTSPQFTKGYMLLKGCLKSETGCDCDIPIFAWGGSPFIEASAFDERKTKAIFLDVPEKYLIYSDYDKFNDFVQEGISDGFLLTKKRAKERIRRGYCVQVCLPWIDPSWVVSVVDYQMVKGLKGTVDDYARYSKLLGTYFELSKCI